MRAAVRYGAFVVEMGCPVLRITRGRRVRDHRAMLVPLSA